MRAGFAAQFHENDVVATGYGGYIQNVPLGFTACGTLRFDRHGEPPEDGLLHSDRGFFATTPLRNQLKTRTNRYTNGTTQFKRISNMSFSVDG